MGAPRGAAGNRRLTAAPTIIVVTGASGVGKTTPVRPLELQHLPNLDPTARTLPQTEQAFIERIRAWHL